MHIAQFPKIGRRVQPARKPFIKRHARLVVIRPVPAQRQQRQNIPARFDPEPKPLTQIRARRSAFAELHDNARAFARIRQFDRQPLAAVDYIAAKRAQLFRYVAPESCLCSRKPRL